MADGLSSRTLLEPNSTRVAAIRSGLHRLQQAPRGITSLPFLSAAEIDLLIADAKGESYRTATPEIEHRGRRVYQDFDVCFPAPRTGAFAALADCLETCLRSADAATGLLPQGIKLNDFAIQRYPAGSRGIGIHRDGRRYHGIVIIITLAGISRLASCSDRAGGGKRRIDDRPGRIVLLTASGFDGRDDENVRPLHTVDQITDGRLSLGFRYEPGAT